MHHRCQCFLPAASPPMHACGNRKTSAHCANHGPLPGKWNRSVDRPAANPGIGPGARRHRRIRACVLRDLPQNTMPDAPSPDRRTQPEGCLPVHGVRPHAESSPRFEMVMSAAAASPSRQPRPLVRMPRGHAIRRPWMSPYRWTARLVSAMVPTLRVQSPLRQSPRRP